MYVIENVRNSVCTLGRKSTVYGQYVEDLVFLKLNLIYTSEFVLKSYVNSIKVFIEGKWIFKVLFIILWLQKPCPAAGFHRLKI